LPQLSLQSQLCQARKDVTSHFMTATVLEKHSGHTPLFASTWCSSAGSSGQVKISWADGSGVSNNWSILFSPPTTWQVAVGRWRSHKALIIWQQLLLLLLLQNSFLLGSLSCSLCLRTLLQIIPCNTYRTSFAACPDTSLLRMLTSWIIQYISPCATFRATEYSDTFWGDQMCLTCPYGLNFQHLGDFLSFRYRGSNYVTSLYVSYVHDDHLCRLPSGQHRNCWQSQSAVHMRPQSSVVNP